MAESFQWFGLTILIWVSAVSAGRALPTGPLASPLLFGIALLCLTLKVFDLDVAEYIRTTRPVTFLVGPATVALAVPLWEQRHLIRANLLAMVLASTVSNVVGLGIAWTIASWVGLPSVELASIMPRMTTLAVALPLSRALGGADNIILLSVMANGIGGVITSSWLLRSVDRQAKENGAFSLGTTSHSLGVAKAAFETPEVVAFASCGMLMSALVTSSLYLAWSAIP